MSKKTRERLLQGQRSVQVHGDRRPGRTRQSPKRASYHIGNWRVGFIGGNDTVMGSEACQKGGDLQALAIQAVVGVQQVRRYDMGPRATEKAASNLQGSGLTVNGQQLGTGRDRGRWHTTSTGRQQYAITLTETWWGHAFPPTLSAAISFLRPEPSGAS